MRERMARRAVRIPIRHRPRSRRTPRRAHDPPASVPLRPRPDRRVRRRAARRPPATTRRAGDSTPARTVKTASDQSDATPSRRRAACNWRSAYFADGQLHDRARRGEAGDRRRPEDDRGLQPARPDLRRRWATIALADDSFSARCSSSPRDGDVMHNYGWYLCLKKRYAEANALFERALAQPQYRDPTRTLLAQGVCEARAGQLVEAERTLQRAYALDPSNAGDRDQPRRSACSSAASTSARASTSGASMRRRSRSSAQSLWLAARIEYRAGNRPGGERDRAAAAAAASRSRPRRRAYRAGQVRE